MQQINKYKILSNFPYFTDFPSRQLRAQLRLTLLQLFLLFFALLFGFLLVDRRFRVDVLFAHNQLSARLFLVHLTTTFAFVPHDSEKQKSGHYNKRPLSIIQIAGFFSERLSVSLWVGNNPMIRRLFVYYILRKLLNTIKLFKTKKLGWFCAHLHSCCDYY